ncbi:MAG: AmmeMemoRadiSam system protein B, partial [Cyclobacteriaceae bacterium]|nr:AmmeMemoRadiSam system protein B [Cyclobacteriaceae bacterium]
MKVREPAVAGSFYPETKEGIEKLIRSILEEEFQYIDTSLAGKNIFGAIVPHAGYVYSGYEAIHVFEILRLSGLVFDTVMIINPNHHGLGPSVAADTNDCWETPLGKVWLDLEIIEFMDIPRAGESHRHEHSGEVMLPFLQLFFPYAFRIVPVSMLNQDPVHSLKLAEKVFLAAR